MKFKKRVKFGIFERENASTTGIKSEYYKAVSMGRRRSKDEMGRFVNIKKEQRWLQQSITDDTGEILAYVLSSHKDEAFLRLKELLEPFDITQYYTDGWRAYERHIEPELHSVGKLNTKKIERKHLTLDLSEKQKPSL